MEKMPEWLSWVFIVGVALLTGGSSVMFFVNGNMQFGIAVGSLCVVNIIYGVLKLLED